MLFARWQHHLRFCSGFSYAPLKAMVTKISKWSRIQHSFRITPKIESLVVCAIPDAPSKFQTDPFRTFRVILLTHRQTDKQTYKQTNRVWQKHYLLGGDNYRVFSLDGIGANMLFWERSNSVWRGCMTAVMVMENVKNIRQCTPFMNSYVIMLFFWTKQLFLGVLAFFKKDEYRSLIYLLVLKIVN